MAKPKKRKTKIEIERSEGEVDVLYTMLAPKSRRRKKEAAA